MTKKKNGWNPVSLHAVQKPQEIDEQRRRQGEHIHSSPSEVARESQLSVAPPQEDIFRGVARILRPFRNSPWYVYVGLASIVGLIAWLTYYSRSTAQSTNSIAEPTPQNTNLSPNISNATLRGVLSESASKSPNRSSTDRVVFLPTFFRVRTVDVDLDKYSSYKYDGIKVIEKSIHIGQGGQYSSDQLHAGVLDRKIRQALPFTLPPKQLDRILHSKGFGIKIAGKGLFEKEREKLDGLFLPQAGNFIYINLRCWKYDVLDLIALLRDELSHVYAYLNNPSGSYSTDFVYNVQGHYDEETDKKFEQALAEADANIARLEKFLGENPAKPEDEEFLQRGLSVLGDYHPLLIARTFSAEEYKRLSENDRQRQNPRLKVLSNRDPNSKEKLTIFYNEEGISYSVMDPHEVTKSPEGKPSYRLTMNYNLRDDQTARKRAKALVHDYHVIKHHHHSRYGSGTATPAERKERISWLMHFPLGVLQFFAPNLCGCLSQYNRQSPQSDFCAQPVAGR